MMVFAAVVPYVMRFLRVDQCLDRGGVYDYAAHLCRFDVQHLPVPDHEPVPGPTVGALVVAAVCLAAGWLVTCASQSPFAVPGNPYNVRTWLRSVLPYRMTGMFPKGADCEARGSAHKWYNIDGGTSGCYHCRVVRPGQLWRDPGPAA